MARFNYAPIAKVANKLIARFGKPAQLVRAGEVGGNEWDPTIGEPLVRNCTLVETEYSSREVDGQTILRTDRRFLIAVKGLNGEITQRDTIKVDTVSFDIVNAQPVRPGATTIVWDVQARQ